MSQVKCQTAVDAKAGTVDVKVVENGNVVGTVSVNVDDLPKGIQRALMLFGTKQKLQNAKAVSGANFTGSETAAKIQEMANQLKADKWSVERASGGPRQDVFHIVMERVFEELGRKWNEKAQAKYNVRGEDGKLTKEANDARSNARGNERYKRLHAAYLAEKAENAGSSATGDDEL